MGARPRKSVNLRFLVLVDPRWCKYALVDARTMKQAAPTISSGVAPRRCCGSITTLLFMIMVLLGDSLGDTVSDGGDDGDAVGLFDGCVDIRV